jgi:hypothetical protein
MGKFLKSGMVAFALAAVSSNAAGEVFDPSPWLDDLSQARDAFASKYSNLEWAQFDADPRLADLIAQTEERVKAAGSDADARAAFDRLARRLGDGHVQFDWPRPLRKAQASATAAAPDICSDYDPSIAAAPLAGEIAGFQVIHTSQSAVFPSGVIPVGQRRVGVIKIGLFGPHATPAYCHAAVAALRIAQDKPCDDACEDRIEHWAAVRMTEDFATQIEALRRAGADVLLIDIAGNGGGSEWVETAARMVTPIRITAEALGFVRGAHWIKKLADLERKLRQFAKTASIEDRAELMRLADQAAAAKAIAETPCDSAPLWSGARPACSWLGSGLWATGLVASADPKALRGKPWAPLVFQAAEVPYQEGVWQGPLIVLVDRGTGSAAEEFAAELQDNHAALILGETTYGVGCGHTDGGTPTRLSHSGVTLELPDCARFRADGSNEVRGIVPDVLVGFHKSDNLRLKAADVMAKLPEALAALPQPTTSSSRRDNASHRQSG